MKTRIISALALAPPALLAIWFGGVWYVLMIGVGALILGWEWDKMCAQGRFGATGAAISLCSAVAALLVFYDAGLALWFVLAAPIAALAAAKIKGPTTVPWAALGGVYVALPVFCLVWLRMDAEQGRAVIVWLFAAVWATDIGAYVAGKSIGGPKLAPGISPKKTWAGLIGGALAAGLISLLLADWGGYGLSWRFFALGLALALAAQAGDLAESAVKRHFGVKDSSGIIPGHGGLFDRVDGLIAAAPLAALALRLG